MHRSMFIAAMACMTLSHHSFADEPVKPVYKVDERIRPLFREYRVAGPGVEQPGEVCLIVCSYSTRPTVMVYTRQINEPLVRLIRKLDEATATHEKEHLGSYVVLICGDQDRAKELMSLAEKEKIRHTLLSLVVVNDARPGSKDFQARFAAETETAVILVNRIQVKASYAYRKGELKDKDVDAILSDLPKILPKGE